MGTEAPTEAPTEESTSSFEPTSSLVPTGSGPTEAPTEGLTEVPTEGPKSPTGEPTSSSEPTVSLEPTSSLETTLTLEPTSTLKPALFNFKGPLKIKRSVEGEPAAVLAAPPTNYNLEFIIEPQSIIERWGSIILLTTGDPYYPDYTYGTMVPSVMMRYETTEIHAYIGYDGNDFPIALVSKPLEVDKKSKVVIKVY